MTTKQWLLSVLEKARDEQTQKNGRLTYGALPADDNVRMIRIADAIRLVEQAPEEPRP